MKDQLRSPALILSVLVALAFAAVIARWIIVTDLAQEVDMHRLSTGEEEALLVERARQMEKEKSQP